jgi:glycopeptide antibiotics resistance protein
MFTSFWNATLSVWSVLVPAWLTFRLILSFYRAHKGHRVDYNHEFILGAFILYASTVFALTNMATPDSSNNNPAIPDLNLVPVINTSRFFISYIIIEDWKMLGFALENIIGNLLLLLPLGIFLPVLFPYFNSFRKVVMFSFSCSVAIEILQFILRSFGSYRTVDIDDVILNTLGGMLGWMIYKKFVLKNSQQKKRPGQTLSLN